jgi:hypothetical protein
MFMTHTVRPGVLCVVGGVVLLLSLTHPVAAAQRSASQPASVRQAAQGTGPATSAPAPFIEDGTAEQTRDQLDRIFEKYPPAVGRVLKLDPSLLSNPAYLAPYPQLAAFVGQHPEVVHNPGYFLENVNAPNYANVDPRWRQREEMRDILAGVAVFAAFLVVTGLGVWFIRVLVTSRRWNRLARVQYEVHSKLLDRFTSNEDLLAYMQTPAGRRFLESAPIRLPDEPASMAAPFSRILWSVQAGIVLLLTGIGLLYVSSTFIDEPAELFRVLGVISLALGGGFIASAVAAYGLSRKLGLLDAAPADHA